MDIYLPIANLSVNALIIVLLGGGVGLLSGMFGVGGGFLVTPLLIFYGIPTSVAAASAASQVTGASVSGAIAHYRRGGVDVAMAMVLILGGLCGSLLGALVFRWLSAGGQIDFVISVLYVALLTGIGLLMTVESIRVLGARYLGWGEPVRRQRHHPLIAALPWRQRFRESRLYVSPLAPFGIGLVTGVLSVLLGVGGGFLMVPAMIYLLGMSPRLVTGTSLLQIIFVTSATTMIHAVSTHAVDIVLAGLLLMGGGIGAQIGARFANRFQPDLLKLMLGLIVLLVALRLALGLGWRPDEIFSVQFD